MEKLAKSFDMDHEYGAVPQGNKDTKKIVAIDTDTDTDSSQSSHDPSEGNVRPKEAKVSPKLNRQS